MKYFIFDTNGALQSSYDSRTGQGAYNTTTPPSGGSSSGGNVSTVAKTILPTCVFWTGNSVMPTSYSSMAFPVVNYAGSNAANMFGDTQMSSPGYITSLAGCINGSTVGSNVYFQVYKNGQPFGLIASNSSTNARAYARANGGSSFSFVAGDVLGIYVKGDSSSINQSFSANIEVTFTA